MSWPLAKLDNHADILSGFAFKSENFNDRGEGLPLVRIRDVVPGFSDTYYSGEYSSEFLLSNGDLLIGMDGDFNRARWNGGRALLNQRVCKITAKGRALDQGYLYHFLPKALDKIHAETPAVTVKHLSVNGIRAIEIPLPPLLEQKRIAAILDKADAIRHKRQQAIQLADDFLRAVFLEMFGDPVTNPKGWPVKPLGNLVINKDGKRVPIKASERADMAGEYPYYGASGVIDYVNDFIFEGPHLLIGEDGANLLARSTPIAFIADGKYWVNNHAHVLGEKERLSLEYLAFSINLRSLESYVSGSAQPKLNQENLNQIPVQVPPSCLIEQFLDVLKVHRRYMNKVGAAEHENLFVSLSQKAFSGQI